MDRIAIIGIPGSGKSTFANKLGKNLGRPIIHLDKEYWTNGWKEKYSKDGWKNFQKELVKESEWIIDGNYRRTIDVRLERADTIIFFNFPKWRCLWRSFIRILSRKQPFDKPDGAKEKINWRSIKFIISYPKIETIKKVENYKNGRTVFVVRNNKEINSLLLKLSNDTRQYWEKKDYKELGKVESMKEVYIVAERILKRMPKPVVQVCGPISSGGEGFANKNLEALKEAIRNLQRQGLNVFDQTPFDMAVRRIKSKTPQTEYFESILVDFHLPLFELGIISTLYFMPNWQTSHGAKWEHEQGEKMKFEIKYI